MQKDITSWGLSLTLGSIIATVTPSYIDHITLLDTPREKLYQSLNLQQTDAGNNKML
ncbi:MAG: hypothetical protein HC908_09990 [Calothrix sp. SM1_7_51]|nr:hypothetical protein [Calothrix sp. SM1_7_51]